MHTHLPTYTDIHTEALPHMPHTCIHMTPQCKLSKEICVYKFLTNYRDDLPPYLRLIFKSIYPPTYLPSIFHLSTQLTYCLSIYSLSYIIYLPIIYLPYYLLICQPTYHLSSTNLSSMYLPTHLLTQAEWIEVPGKSYKATSSHRKTTGLIFRAGGCSPCRRRC